MNERIKELKGMTLDKHFSYTWTTMDYDDVSRFAEKFAELIVRECSKVIRQGGYRRGAFGYEDLRPSEIATMIEEHFGVEK